MAKFIQISDLHIHTNNDEHENRTLKKLVSNIINKYSVEKPVVLITGDIVDDGKEEQLWMSWKYLYRKITTTFSKNDSW